MGKSIYTIFQLTLLFLPKMAQKYGIDNGRLKPILSHVFPKEGDMVSRKLNHRLGLDFFKDAFDLKKHVFIDARKQARQKMEGFSACQF